MFDLSRRSVPALAVLFLGGAFAVRGTVIAAEEFTEPAVHGADLGPIGEIVVVGHVLLASVLWAVALVSLRDDRMALPAGVFVGTSMLGGTVFLAISATQWSAGLVLGAGAIVTLWSAIGTWYSVGRLDRQYGSRAAG